MRVGTKFSKNIRTTLVSVGFALAVLLPASGALHAEPVFGGSFVVAGCNASTTRNADRWTHFVEQPYSGAGNSCGAEPGLHARPSNYPNAKAGWRFSAEPGTYITGFAL
jgi:hypothetical protein